MKKYSLLIILIIIAALFFVIFRFTKKPPVAQEEKSKQPLSVSVQTAQNSKALTQDIKYPATVVGNQEIKLTAKSAGNAAEVNFELGKKVSAGSLLVKIDNTGNTLEVGDEGFRSAQIQQDQLSVNQAEEQLKTARKTRNKLQSAYNTQKKNLKLTKTVSKAQIIAAEGQVEVAEVQLENAQVGLKSGLDDHLITSPITGYVTSKSISTGDSITLGQELATISKTADVKVQFFVDREQLASITEGMKVGLIDSNGNSYPVIVKNISPDADSTTRRFLVEAFPEESNSSVFLSGTIMTVSFPVTITPQQAGDLILPLAAITIGQNESYIFLMENNRAKKVVVSVQNVQGGTAEIKVDTPESSKIIVSGSKLVQDGDPVQIEN